MPFEKWTKSWSYNKIWKPQSINLSEENIGENLDDVELGSILQS